MKRAKRKKAVRRRDKQAPRRAHFLWRIPRGHRVCGFAKFADDVQR